MLNMKEKTLLGLIISLAAALTASLILAKWTYDVKLLTDPEGLNVYASANKPFKISCQGSGGEESEYSSMRWLDPEGNIFEEGNPSVEKEGNLLFLIFSNPETKDSGAYRCTALYDNEHDLQYVVNIYFQGPQPTFETSFENVTAEVGARFQIYCYAEGEPPMTYSWYNQYEDRITEDSSMPIYASSFYNYSALIIPEVKENYEGMYTCTASNSYGLESKLYSLHVSPGNGNDKDNITSDFTIEVVNISVSSVQFRIPTTENVRFIEVMYHESRDPTEYRSSFKPVPGHIYTMIQLVPSGLYSFQFRVFPSETMAWSEVHQVVLLPDVPEIIFQNLENRSVKLQWFRKIDDIMRETVDMHEIKYYSVSMKGGNSWVASTCALTIQIPSCFGSSYTISGLQSTVYYQIEVRAHTVTGYGEPIRQKIYLER